MTDLATGFIIAASFWSVVIYAVLSWCKANNKAAAMIALPVGIFLAAAGLGMEIFDHKPGLHCETVLCTEMSERDPNEAASPN